MGHNVQFGKIIKNGNKLFRKTITAKSKKPYKEAIKNKNSDAYKYAVAITCQYVVSKLQEEVKQCKSSEDPDMCRKNGMKLINSYKKAYKKVVGKPLNT